MNAGNAAQQENHGRAHEILAFVAREWTALVLAAAIVIANGLASLGGGSIV